MSVSKAPARVIELARKIRLVALDVDGVLTDGSLHYGRNGEETKRFHVRDGMGLRVLLDAGVEVAVITARTGEPLARRLRDLNITSVQTSVRDKGTALRQLAEERKVALEQICYVGDDLLDLPALRVAGLAVSVADGHAAARAVAHFVTEHRGGEGAVRDVVDLILDAQVGLEVAYDRHLAGEQREAAGRAGCPAFGVVIPARYASTRLPGKPLRDLAGKPMVLRVMENASRSGAEFVVVATDDERIARVVEQAGGHAVLTSPEHPSGTDRLAEAVAHRQLSRDQLVVNVQGDEPLLDPELVRTVAAALHAHPQAGLATLATPIRSRRELFDPNAVKVVLAENGFAEYFSRAPIPWVRDAFGASASSSDALPSGLPFLRHVGLYCYRVATLEALAALPPSEPERAECLEQLRALSHGIAIHTTVVDEPPGHGVDTEEDLARVAAEIRARSAPARDPRAPEGRGG